MSKSSKSDETSNKLLWLAGGAAVTAAAMYYVNKHLNERDDLRRLRYAEDQKRLKESGGE